MLYYAVLCYAMLCYVMLCYAMLYYAVLWYAMLCYASAKKGFGNRGPPECRRVQKRASATGVPQSAVECKKEALGAARPRKQVQT